ncbi:hypothetical protein Bbelb_066750 [Branchiostoma belcheri]|nr:hypothetical protein Bbelb_066750 [Branchiostoma belcheri]
MNLDKKDDTLHVPVEAIISWLAIGFQHATNEKVATSDSANERAAVRPSFVRFDGGRRGYLMVTDGVPGACYERTASRDSTARERANSRVVRNFTPCISSFKIPRIYPGSAYVLDPLLLQVII